MSSHTVNEHEEHLIQLTRENELLKEKIKALETQLSQSNHKTSAPSTTSTNITEPSPVIPASNVTTSSSSSSTSSTSSSSDLTHLTWSHGLSTSNIVRYSRQILLSDFGVDAQSRLLSSSVLIIGAGGLGCPVAIYLAAAGIGKIGIVDGDRVDVTNLHRQILHTEKKVGMNKAESIRDSCLALNSTIQVIAYPFHLSVDNALSLVSQYDIIVDASDNPATRYLVNDATILQSKVLVSGSALRMEGQITVYGYKGGPCYRCIYPTPPPPETVTNCSDGGVIGAVTGIIGSIQALEVIKLAAGLVADPTASSTSTQTTSALHVPSTASLSTFSSRLLLMDGGSSAFRAIRLRGRNKDCAVCGEHPKITLENFGKTNDTDYVFFCGSGFHDKFVANLQSNTSIKHITVEEAQSVFQKSPNHHPLILDVREPVQYRICALKDAVNVPLRVLKRDGPPQWLKDMLMPSSASSSNSAPIQSFTPHPFDNHEVLPPSSSSTSPSAIYIVCRRGIDSITATQVLNDYISKATEGSSTTATSTTGNGTPPVTPIYNLKGGLVAWSTRVDPSFPIY